MCVALFLLSRCAKENGPLTIDIFSPVENRVYEADSLWQDQIPWNHKIVVLEADVQDPDGLIQVSVQIWNEQQEFFNKVYNLNGETTFNLRNWWMYQGSTGDFEVRFRAEDADGEQLLKIRKISIAY